MFGVLIPQFIILLMTFKIPGCFFLQILLKGLLQINLCEDGHYSLILVSILMVTGPSLHKFTCI